MIELLALGAALCYAVGVVLQHREAAAQAAEGSLLGRLIRQPLWHLGLLVNAVGFVLQAAALRSGQLVVVQPLLVCSVLFTLPCSAWTRHQRVGPREWWGSLAVAVGLSAFLLAARPAAGTTAPQPIDWLRAVAGTASAAAVCVALARGGARATLLGTAAGILFGLTAAFMKAAALRLGPDLTQVLGAWPLYAMAVTTFTAFWLMQRAFQAGPLVASFPALTALDPLTSSLLGIALYGERLQAGGPAMATAFAGASAIFYGIVTLSRSALLEPVVATEA